MLWNNVYNSSHIFALQCLQMFTSHCLISLSDSAQLAKPIVLRMWPQRSICANICCIVTPSVTPDLYWDSQPDKLSLTSKPPRNRQCIIWSSSKPKIGKLKREKVQKAKIKNRDKFQCHLNWHRVCTDLVFIALRASKVNQRISNVAFIIAHNKT